MRVMIIEDDEDDLNFLQRNLKRAIPEIDLTICQTLDAARTALDIVSRQAQREGETEDGAMSDEGFEALISDFTLPDGTGTSFIRYLRELGLTFPTIMLTGDSSEDVAIDALRAGVADYLTKDTQGQYLATVPVLLRRAVEAHQASRARKAAEVEAIAARERADRANAAKAKFLATAGHDMRQPLHAMGLFIEALNKRKTDQKDGEILEHLNQGIATLGGMLDSLYEMSQIEAGFVRPKLTNVDIQSLFDQLATESIVVASNRGIALKYRAAPNLPLVHSDPLLLQRIVRNLVSNAIRYSMRNKVLVTARPIGQQVMIEVWDTGPGISDDVTDKIYDEFQRFDSRSKAEGGLGLGLFIVDRLSNLLGLVLDLRTSPSGCVFRIAMNAEISQRQTTAGQGESFHKNSKMRSLWIIDDDQTISEALSLAVTKWKMRITCMTSVAEVSQRLHKEPAPDAALIDYDLGHSLNGLDAANVIRHLNTTSKIVIVTGNSDRQTIEKIEESGFPCLLKPVDTKAIARALNITAIE